MTSFKLPALFAFLLFLPLAASAQLHEASHTCGTNVAAAGGAPSSVSYKYCIDQVSGKASGDVLFYFHGLNASEQEFNAVYATTVFKNLAAVAQTPTVISISFGPVWFLTDAPTSLHPALHDLVVTSVIPQMERQLGRPIRHRLLMGESMGGFNAIQVLTKNSTLFSDAVLLCPAISTLSPTSSDGDLKNYAAAHPGVDLAQLTLARQLAQEEFSTADAWSTHDPLKLASLLSRTTPPFFISGGTKDEWGFYEGQKHFAALARTAGAPVVWFSISGQAHCVQTAESIKALVSFLSKVEQPK